MPEISRPGPLARPRALLAVVRLYARRLRLTRWVAAVLIGGAVAVSTTGIIADAETRRDRWSTVEDVWVLTADVAAGSTLESSHLEQLTLPEIAVPRDAVPAGAGSPSGRRLRADGHRGEVLLEPRLAPAGASPVASRLPEGTRGVTVPTDETDPFEVGDEADLFDLATGRLVVTETRVVAVAADGTTFAVDADRVGSVISALAGGGVVAALVP